MVTSSGGSFDYWVSVKDQINAIAHTLEDTDNMKLIRLGLAIPRGEIAPGGFDYRSFDNSIDKFYQRPDIFLNLMIDNLTTKLEGIGYTIHNKVLLQGFSMGGGFTYAYCLLQPDRVQAIAAGGVSHLIIPESSYSGTVLDYPLGVNDFHSLAGYQFNKGAFMTVPKFIYLGDQDIWNDNVVYGDFWPDNSMVDFLNNTFGDTAPIRMTNMSSHIIQLGCNLEFKIYPGVGHTWNPDMQEDVYAFLGKNIETTNLLYTPVTPCRIVDTRKAGGAISAGGIRSYNVRGAVASQGGNSAGCPSPKGEPRAVHVNVTSVPLGNGWITAYPYGSTAPTASLVNYRSDAQNVANSGTIKTCSNCRKDISIKSGGGTTHVIIDVLGYYYSKP